MPSSDALEARLEDLTPNTSLRGILPNGLATAVSVQWHDSEALELTYKNAEGKVVLDPKRVGRDAGRIADEVISHLKALVDAEVTVTLEIEAKIPSGAPDTVVRTVTENSRTLKFANQGFEEGVIL